MQYLLSNEIMNICTQIPQNHTRKYSHYNQSAVIWNSGPVGFEYEVDGGYDVCGII